MSGGGLKRMAFRAGARIFREGDVGDKAYIVESGTVEISKEVAGGETVVITVVGKGAMIGDMALIDNQPRAATARVVEDAVLVVIERVDFEDRLGRSDPVVRRLLKILVERLRAQNVKLAQQTAIYR